MKPALVRPLKYGTISAPTANQIMPFNGRINGMALLLCLGMCRNNPGCSSGKCMQLIGSIKITRSQSVPIHRVLRHESVAQRRMAMGPIDGGCCTVLYDLLDKARGLNALQRLSWSQVRNFITPSLDYGVQQYPVDMQQCPRNYFRHGASAIPTIRP